MKDLALIINPGSTSTKISIFKVSGIELYTETIRHDPQEIARFDKVGDQREFRKSAIDSFLKKNKIPEDDFAFIVARGGLLKPIKSGTWIVNGKMIEELIKAERGQHACNLGAIIAFDIAKANQIQSYIVDPVVVDELCNLARITGIPEIKRTSIFHALNQKAVARKTAQSLKVPYNKANFIVVHMGGGITVGAHCKGKVIDVNNGIYGEGPLSPERSGSIPAQEIVNLCFSRRYTKEEIDKIICGRGGVIAHIGTSDMRVVEDEIKKKNKKYKLIYDAMIYQIAKETGAMATVLKGKVNCITLTGGLAFDKYLVKELTSRIKFIAPVKVFAGEDEMEALFRGASLSIKGEAPLNDYK